jgi:anti-sigma B factor antagonist
MPEDAVVGIETVPGGVVLSPGGDIDLSRSPLLRVSLRQAQSSRPARMIVDLEHVDYMDSSGIATLVEALQNARRAGTTMVLCGMKERVRSIFEIARLDTVFTIVETRREALGA